MPARQFSSPHTKAKKQTPDEILFNELCERLARAERSLTAIEIEQATWHIWGYVRDNKDSLDSERHNKGVRGIIIDAVGDVQKRLEAQVKETAASEKKLREVRKQKRELQKEYDELFEIAKEAKEGASKTIAIMDRQVEKLTMDLDIALNSLEAEQEALADNRGD